MDRVRELELPPCVDNIEDEFQGEWNTLCLFVRVRASTTEPEIAELEERFEACLVGALPPSGESIDWSVGFWKEGKLLSSIESE